MAKFLDTTQAAELTGDSIQHISRSCARGRIPAEKVGGQWRIDKSGLLAWASDSARAARAQQSWSINGPAGPAPFRIRLEVSPAELARNRARMADLVRRTLGGEVEVLDMTNGGGRRYEWGAWRQA